MSDYVLFGIVGLPRRFVCRSDGFHGRVGAILRSRWVPALSDRPGLPNIWAGLRRTGYCHRSNKQGARSLLKR